jgi:hypothetical protein
VRRHSAARLASVGLSVVFSLLVSGALIAPPAALGDGDPASDVLVSAELFNPIDSGIPASTVGRLEDVLAASAKAGFSIRVALINSANDLGTVTALWQQPRAYARYLWIELSVVNDGQVLVVMPNGFGLYGPNQGAHAITAAELRVGAPSPARGIRLASSALVAVTSLARADGHPIPAAGTDAAASRPVMKSGTPTVSLTAGIALALGLILVASCWRLKARRGSAAGSMRATKPPPREPEIGSRPRDES